MAKLKLEVVTRATVEVELPEKCPGCGEPLGEDSELVLPLKEEGWGGIAQDVRLSVFGGEWQVSDAGVDEHVGDGDLSIRTGLRCNACDGLLVTTEPTAGRQTELVSTPIPLPGWCSADPWAALEAIQQVMTDAEATDALKLSTVGRILMEAGL